MSDILINIIIILLLILINGLFALSEMAIVSARTTRLTQMADAGNGGASVALRLAANPTRFFSTAQVGITLVGVFAGAFGGANLADRLAVVLAEITWLEPYASSVSFLFVVGTITYLSVVVGELVPKRLALTYAEPLAAMIAQPMNLLSWLAGPFVNILTSSTEIVFRLLKLKAPEGGAIDEEELRMLMAEGTEIGAINEKEFNMIESIFGLDDRPLVSMMTARPEIIWLDVNTSMADLQEIVHTSNHTRFPVCDGDIDKVLGIVRSKDILSTQLDGEPLNIRAIMQEPLIMPDRLPALHALERFKEAGVHLALVYDEYGGVKGLVTLIDILEAIVGDIPSPDEVETPPIVQREDGSWLVEGLINITDFREAFAIEMMPGGERYHTLGGFVMFMLGKIPAAGESFIWNRFRFEVADMDGRRVDKVLLQVRELDQ